MLSGKKVLFAWELGNNFGHIADISYISSLIIEKGGFVYVSLKELHNAEQEFLGQDVIFIQAPVWHVPYQKNVKVFCMADIFLGRGYDNQANLETLVKAWQSIYEVINPDLVLFDYAPTALLAAQKYSFRKVCIGIGYGTLPPNEESINLRPDLAYIEENIRISESRVVSNINRVSKRLNLKGVKYLGDLFDVDETVVTNIPELDLYGETRKTAKYFYPSIKSKGLRNDPVWPESPGKKIFVYFKTYNERVEAILTLLSEFEFNILLSIRKISEENIEHCKNLGIMVSVIPVDMLKVFEHCDFVVANGGHTVVQSILAGKPVIVVPTQLEQRNTARLVESHQLGVCFGMNEKSDAQRNKIKSLLYSRSYVNNAIDIANKYKQKSNVRDPSCMVDVFEKLI